MAISTLPSGTALPCPTEHVQTLCGQATDPAENNFWELPEAEEPFEPVELDWFDCPILGRQEMFDQIRRKGALDGQSLNLLSALTRPPRSGLLDHYIAENLYRPGSHYIYVTPDAEC